MPNPNELLVWGWNVQGAGYANQAVNGVPGQGYAMAANAPAAANVSTALQAGGGLPYPAGAENVQGEAAGSQTAQILTNPVYAGSPGLITPGNLTPPALPTSGTGIAVNPSGLEAAVTIATGAGATVTAVSVAPAGSSTFTSIGFTLAASSDGQIQIPGAGQVKITYTGTPTWVWTAVN